MVSVPGLSRSCTCLTFALACLAATAAVAGQESRANCSDPQTCRELALDARSRQAYETFHDLAWRAVQTGRPNDPELMYLVARAQALSGRRRDAVIMLRRLAEAGFANDAATDDDFRSVRELPEWRIVMDIVSRQRPTAAPAAAALPVSRPAAPSTVVVPTPASVSPKPAVVAPSPAVVVPTPAVVTPKLTVSPTPAAAAPVALRLEPASVEEVARFSTRSFTPAGLAYDAVSKRFLFGDLAGRRLFVVGEGSDRATDLIRGESAGFDEVTSFAIDPKRGHLWVASTAADGRGGAVHHLQLISGRALAKLEVPGQGPVHLADVAVAGDGTVFVLDSAAPRILVLRPGASALAVLMSLKTPDPVGLSVDEAGRFAYVAHRDGIARIDVQARRATAMEAAKSVSLIGFEFIRLNRDVLIGSQRQPDGSRGLVRLRTSGNRVTGATLIETLSADESPRGPATVAGTDLYYLVAAESPDSGSGLMNVRVRRVKLP